MKKIILLLISVFIVLPLSACDFPEKSLQTISASDFPDEVTMDFYVPRGVYAPIKYDSYNEAVLKPTNDYGDTRFSLVEVFQQEEDVSVTLVARVNNASKSFVIKVLKVGSQKTDVERCVVASNDFEMRDRTSESFILSNPFEDINMIVTRDQSYSRYIDILEKEKGVFKFNIYLDNVTVTIPIKLTFYLNKSKHIIYRELTLESSEVPNLDSLYKANLIVCSLRDLEINDVFEKIISSKEELSAFISSGIFYNPTQSVNKLLQYFDDDYFQDSYLISLIVCDKYGDIIYDLDSYQIVGDKLFVTLNRYELQSGNDERKNYRTYFLKVSNSVSIANLDVEVINK